MTRGKVNKHTKKNKMRSVRYFSTRTSKKKNVAPAFKSLNSLAEQLCERK